MKKLNILIMPLLLFTACDNDLDQIPPKDFTGSNLTDLAGVLKIAYHYHTAAATPMAVMGDFRADNMLMAEEPYPAFDRYNSDLADGNITAQFMQPFYSNLYKSILSANSVIANSTVAKEVAEAKFLRALSYFKLVMVFGDVSVILTPQPDLDELPNVDLTRQAASIVYSTVIIPDLNDAIAGLAGSTVTSGRATVLAAQGILAKVYMYTKDFAKAEPLLATIKSTATAAGVQLETDFANVVRDDQHALGASTEVIFSTRKSTSIPDPYGFTEFSNWFDGVDTKSRTPLDPDLTAAFDASSAAGGATDKRKALTINTTNKDGIKHKTGADNQNWVELRLSDVYLYYAEALNENADNATARGLALDQLDAIRIRAGLSILDENDPNYDTQAEVRQAIQIERRVELALEGHRWFDLVRTGTVDAEMGQTINANYHLFPLPESETLASGGVITQNPGYDN